MFTPRAHDGERLAPWIALVVVQDGPALRQRPGEGPLPPIFSIPMGELQPIDDVSAWAWAHAQVAGGVKDVPSEGIEGVPTPGVDGAPSVDDRLAPSNALANLSRLVCPRRLQPNTAYVACVVPTFDAGVKPVLGLAVPGTLGPAWTRAAGDEANVIDLPVYYHWRFQTGPEGDFRTLAERLTGMAAPWYVGRRMLDAANPRGRMAALAAGDSGPLQVVKGPLVAPRSRIRPERADPAEAAGAIAETAAWAAARTNELRALLNEPDQLAAKPGALADADFPRVGPSIYARYQAATTRIGDLDPAADPGVDSTWLSQVNLRPANRVVAGLGTRVVQKDQEALMQAAWMQVGAIERTNQQIRWAQIGRFAGASFHARNLNPLPFSSLLNATRRLHSRVLVADQTTLTARIAESATPISAVTATFRRATRVEGPIARYAVGDARAQITNMLGAQAAPRDFQRGYVELDGIAGLSSQSFALFDQEHVASVLGGRTLEDVGAALGSNPVVRTIQDRAATAFAANPTLFPVDLGASRSNQIDRHVHAGGCHRRARGDLCRGVGRAAGDEHQGRRTGRRAVGKAHGDKQAHPGGGGREPARAGGGGNSGGGRRDSRRPRQNRARDADRRRSQRLRDDRVAGRDDRGAARATASGAGAGFPAAPRARGHRRAADPDAAARAERRRLESADRGATNRAERECVPAATAARNQSAGKCTPAAPAA